jgi:hypothetical protein
MSVSILNVCLWRSLAGKLEKLELYKTLTKSSSRSAQYVGQQNKNG